MKVMEGMMSTLLSRDVLYPSINDLCKQVRGRGRQRGMRYGEGGTEGVGRKGERERAGEEEKGRGRENPSFSSIRIGWRAIVTASRKRSTLVTAIS